MEKQVKMTVIVPEHLKRAARIKALQEGTSLTALVREWMAAYLAKPPNKEPEK